MPNSNEDGLPTRPIAVPSEPASEPLTLRTLNRMARQGVPFACLTCYDATTARWLQRAGVHVLLVGDTAAEVILGHRRTIDMPMEVLLALTAAVKRGAPGAVVMGDMPFMSYHGSPGRAIENAGRFMTEGQADIVKLEVDSSFAPLVDRLARAGVPVCAHIGSRPQRAWLSGGYGAAGRTADEARRIVEDAITLEQAGSVMLLVEAVPDEVTDAILAVTKLPVIGIGAGTACHGQVLVIQDLLGLSDAPPRFADPVADFGTALRSAGQEWVRRVAERSIGGRRYTMDPAEARQLAEYRDALARRGAAASALQRWAALD